MRHRWQVGTVSLLAFVLGCSHELEGHALPSAPKLALDPPRAVFVQGGSVELVLLATNSRGEQDVVDGPVTWASNARSIEALAGQVIATAPGIATITATIQSIKSEATVVAVPRQPTALALSPLAVALAYGATGKVSAIVQLDAAAGEPKTADVSVGAIWTTSDAAVVEVTAGSLRRVGIGDATITASAAGLAASLVVSTPQ